KSNRGAVTRNSSSHEQSFPRFKSSPSPNRGCRSRQWILEKRSFQEATEKAIRIASRGAVVAFLVWFSGPTDAGRRKGIGDDQAKGLANQSLNAALRATDHHSSNRKYSLPRLGSSRGPHSARCIAISARIYGFGVGPPDSAAEQPKRIGLRPSTHRAAKCRT